MSNNAPDYKENLAFPPKAIGSQDELPEVGRTTAVLIHTLEKLKEEDFVNKILDDEIGVALKALREIEMTRSAQECRDIASMALEEIFMIEEIRIKHDREQSND